MGDKYKIFIVDDHEIFRNGLKMVLGRLKYLEVAGEASNGKEFLNALDVQSPDIVLMDIEMPIMNGIEATIEALNIKPDLKIIALTMFNEDEYVQNMIDAGVRGFLIKNINKETLDKAIQTVINGGNYFSEELFKFFARQMGKEKKKDIPDLELTRREKEILQLICEGLSNKEIADALFISERTVVGHKSNLLAKTDCKNSMSLMAFAIKNKLVVI
ncbi:MAG: Transcriptional regulatory protein DegU [Bacteroidetes bacterium ADurb.Bin408]|nr:MAG: Transcriptional regulatory protein DegU [Bacteroidetes bacterium ADurb.Bin408]